MGWRMYRALLDQAISLLVANFPQILIISGICAFSRAFRSRPAIERALTSLGFFLGMALLAGSIHMFLAGPRDAATILIGGILGLGIFLRPIRGLRWAALLALLVGLTSSYMLIRYLMVSSALVIAFGFLVPALLTYIALKFLEDLLQVIGGILSFPP
ncbi:MAG: hypothetical protein QXV89_06730, partial [Candidatus Bathyarchaeia archaeon]